MMLSLRSSNRVARDPLGAAALLRGAWFLCRGAQEGGEESFEIQVLQLESSAADWLTQHGLLQSVASRCLLVEHNKPLRRHN